VERTLEQVQEVLFVRQDERGLVGGRGRYWKLEELGTHGEKRLRQNLSSILAFPSPPVMNVLRLTVLCLFVYLFFVLVFQLVYFVVQLRPYFLSQNLAIADF